MKSTFLFRGANIQYRDQGKGSALVLIHGFLGCQDLWEAQFKDLRKIYRVISLDLPAHGGSDSLGYLHSMELLADLVNGLVKHLKLRKIHLVGHSLGGYIALAFAEKYTDKLKSVILINSSAAADTEQRKKSRQQMIKLLPKKRDPLIKKLVQSFFVVESLKRRHIVRKYQRWALGCDDRGIVATVRGMMERKEREIILKFAPYPYLIIIGKQDPIISIKQSRLEAKLGAKGELLIYEDSGHMSPLEIPWKLNSAISAFLRKVS